MNTIDITTLNSEDIIDVRDIIERVEELEGSSLTENPAQEAAELRKELEANGGRGIELAERIDSLEELVALTAIMEDLKGYGGDEQWRGDWYPVTLIRESYFVDYVQELLEDCGEIPRNLPHYIHIDWERTARDVRVDYSTVEIDGVTYLYR